MKFITGYHGEDLFIFCIDDEGINHLVAKVVNADLAEKLVEQHASKWINVEDAKLEYGKEYIVETTDKDVFNAVFEIINDEPGEVETGFYVISLCECVNVERIMLR